MKKVLKHLVVLLFVVNLISLGFGCSQSQRLLRLSTTERGSQGGEATSPHDPLPALTVGQSQTTLPTATLSAMLEAAEAGNWEQYVDEYYGEQHKFKSSSDRDKLVSRFREKWGSEVIAGLKEASQVKPELSEDGTQARFQLSDGELILYKNEQGNWTFHL